MTKKRTRLVWPLLALAVFSAVIWAKLRLVAGIPRTAYAEPERSAPAKGD